MSLPLSRPFQSRDGVPIIETVDPRIFTLSYFGRCMECNFCQDACCRFGADVELPKMHAIEARAEELEAYLGRPRTEWFRTDPEDIGVIEEPQYPGGFYTRTSVVPMPVGRSEHFDESCIFLDPVSRGCRLHRFAMERNIDVHEIKPFVCILFPLCYDNGDLHPALELEIDELICQGPGVSLYRSVRDEVAYYFGSEMVHELDEMEALTLNASPSPASSLIPLTVRAD